jgi:hypothetical protein
MDESEVAGPTANGIEGDGGTGVGDLVTQVPHPLAPSPVATGEGEGPSREVIGSEFPKD